MGADAVAKSKIKQDYLQMRNETNQAAAELDNRIMRNQEALAVMHKERMGVAKNSTQAEQERDSLKSDVIREQARQRDANDNAYKLDQEIQSLMSGVD